MSYPEDWSDDQPPQQPVRFFKTFITLGALIIAASAVWFIQID